MANVKNFSKEEEAGSFSPTDANSDIHGDHQAIDPVSGVKRGLKTRHLSMMALAGIVRLPCPSVFATPFLTLSVFTACISFLAKP